jgi:hypothetical protein
MFASLINSPRRPNIAISYVARERGSVVYNQHSVRTDNIVSESRVCDVSANAQVPDLCIVNDAFFKPHMIRIL